jgi:gamma-glutamylcyclotransferase (GGCT)/AIG2-like uncharacterized protein YtfP
MSLTDLYFAYGADMDLATVKARAGEAQFVSPARLVGYRVAFFGHNPVWDSGQETIVAEVEAETWGVLYRLRAAEWDRLDACMGATIEGSGAYFHYPVEVVTSRDECFQVRTYRKSSQGKACPPSTEHLDFLIRSAASQGVPTSYQELLRAMPSTSAKYRVPRMAPGGRIHLPLL